MREFVIPGRAKREPGISRFRVCSCGPSRNDEYTLHLLSRGRSRRLTLALLLARLLLGVAAAIDTAGDRTEHAMMDGIVTGDAADHGALQAALGVGRRG